MRRPVAAFLSRGLTPRFTLSEFNQGCDRSQPKALTGQHTPK